MPQNGGGRYLASRLFDGVRGDVHDFVIGHAVCFWVRFVQNAVCLRYARTFLYQRLECLGAADAF